MPFRSPTNSTNLTFFFNPKNSHKLPNLIYLFNPEQAQWAANGDNNFILPKSAL